MRRLRHTSVVLALLLGLAVAATPVAQAAEPVSSVETAQKKKKAKKKKKRAVKCKARQVKERVKVGKRTRTRCVARKRAWPAPKPVDMRTESTGYVLDANFSKVRDRRGRRAKSLPKLLKRIHPRAERALERATKAGLARMDARARASQSGTGCTEQPTGRFSSSFDAGGGQSVDLTHTTGPEASLQLGLESNQGNRKVRVEIEFPGCESHSFDSCPTANGDIRGKDNRRISVRATVTEGTTVVWSQGIRLEGETTFRGVVDDNAKLDFMEPHNTEVGTLTLGGTNRGFSPLSIRMLVQRITRVEFPEKTYQLGPSTVNATITSPDLSGAALTATEHEIERGMREQADQQFRDIIAKAIKAFDDAEAGWNRENACASIDFTPGANSKTLHRGESGGFDARTNAKPGGSPEGATWTLTGGRNAEFSPYGASSNPARFSHGAPVDVNHGLPVTTVVRSVSKAGVAQATWWQPTEGEPPVNRIAGSIGGRQNTFGTIFTWSGSVSFVRVAPGAGGPDGYFNLQTSQYTVIASGRDGSGATACQQSGTKTVTGGSGDLQVRGEPPSYGEPPYTYTGGSFGPLPDSQTMTVTLHDCPPGAEEYEGREVTASISVAPFDTRGGRVSTDGKAFKDSVTETSGQATFTWNWDMTGSP